MNTLLLKLTESIAKATNNQKIFDFEDLKQTLQRLHKIEEKERIIEVHTTSDLLNLDHKIVLEKLIIESASLIDIKNISVYFKRSEAATNALKNTQPPKMPKQPTSRTTVLGAKINKRAIPGVTKVIAVASGKGGVGKSTISSNLAAALSILGKKVGLMDADVYGPSSPMMLGISGKLGISSNDKILPLEGYGVKCVSFGFLTDAQSPVMWRGPMVAKAINQLCYDVEWGELDYLVVDLPPGTGDVQLTLIENTPITTAVIVSTPQDIALIDAHKALSMFQKTETPVLGIVENMSVFQCPKCGHEEHIFGSEEMKNFEKIRQIPIIAEIPLHITVRKGGDQGKPIVTDESSPMRAKFLELANKILLFQ